MNGIGERTGNANLMTIIPTLQLKMGMNGVGEHLTNLTALSRFTDEQASPFCRGMLTLIFLQVPIMF